MSPTASKIKQQLIKAKEHCQRAAEEEARMVEEEAGILLALEQQEHEEEERWIAEEKRIVEEQRLVEKKAQKEVEEKRLEEKRLEAGKEAEEAQRVMKVTQKSQMININMTEDSEWGPVSPYSMSMVMLQLLEQENCAEGSRRGQSRSTATLASPVAKKKGLPTPVELLASSTPVKLMDDRSKRVREQHQS